MNETVKKILAIGAGALIVGGAFAFAGNITTLSGTPAPNVDKILRPGDVSIVVPTTLEVNGTPLHIKNDAYEASLLALDIFTHNPKMVEKEITATFKVPVRSLNIEDSDQEYYLTNADFSELELPDGIQVLVNFSRIDFNTTSMKTIFHDGAIVIHVNGDKFSLVDGNYTLYSYQKDGKDILRLFKVMNETKTFGFGNTYSLDGFEFVAYDYQESEQRVLSTIKFDGHISNAILNVGETYVVYVVNNDTVIKELSSVNLNTLKETVDHFVTFTINDVFIGVKNTNVVTLTTEDYKMVKEYHDGDKWMELNNWIMDIKNPVNGQVPFDIILSVDNPNTDDEEVLVANDLEIPMAGLSIHTTVETDDDGNYVFHAYYFEQLKTKTGTVTIQVPDLNVDPESVIVTDADIVKFGIPDDRNIVIVGGWVSNKAWTVLENELGSTIISQLKSEVMNEGYIVKFIQNPDNPSKYIIIVAGRDYQETAKAVEELMEELEKN